MKNSTSYKVRKILWYIVAIIAIFAFIYLASEPRDNVAIIEFVPGKIRALVVLFCCGVIIMRHVVAIVCVLSAWAYKHVGIRNETCKWAYEVEANKGFKRFYIWVVRRYDRYVIENHIYENLV